MFMSVSAVPSPTLKVVVFPPKLRAPLIVAVPLLEGSNTTLPPPVKLTGKDNVVFCIERAVLALLRVKVAGATKEKVPPEFKFRVLNAKEIEKVPVLNVPFAIVTVDVVGN